MSNSLHSRLRSCVQNSFSQVHRSRSLCSGCTCTVSPSSRRCTLQENAGCSATTMYPVCGVFCFYFILRNVGFPTKFVEVAGLGSDLVNLVRVGEFSTALAFPSQVLAGLTVVVLGLAVGTQVLGFFRGNTSAHNSQPSLPLISGIKSAISK